jgi:hypothetical protein
LRAGNNSGAPGGNPAELAGSNAMTQQGVGNPPRSKIKGHKKEKRLKRGINAEAKRKI